MNQEIPLSGGDAIINAVSGQWGIASDPPVDIAIGKGNNINIIVKSRNVNTGNYNG